MSVNELNRRMKRLERAVTPERKLKVITKNHDESEKQALKRSGVKPDTGDVVVIIYKFNDGTVYEPPPKPPPEMTRQEIDQEIKALRDSLKQESGLTDEEIDELVQTKSSSDIFEVAPLRSDLGGLFR